MLWTRVERIFLVEFTTQHYSCTALLLLLLPTIKITQNFCKRALQQARGNRLYHNHQLGKPILTNGEATKNENVCCCGGPAGGVPSAGGGLKTVCTAPRVDGLPPGASTKQQNKRLRFTWSYPLSSQDIRTAISIHTDSAPTTAIPPVSSGMFAVCHLVTTACLRRDLFDVWALFFIFGWTVLYEYCLRGNPQKHPAVLRCPQAHPQTPPACATAENASHEHLSPPESWLSVQVGVCGFTMILRCVAIDCRWCVWRYYVSRFCDTIRTCGRSIHSNVLTTTLLYVLCFVMFLLCTSRYLVLCTTSITIANNTKSCRRLQKQLLVVCHICSSYEQGGRAARCPSAVRA